MNMDDERAARAYAAPLTHRDPSTYEGRRDMKETQNYDGNECYDKIATRLRFSSCFYSTIPGGGSAKGIPARLRRGAVIGGCRKPVEGMFSSAGAKNESFAGKTPAGVV